MRNFFTDIKLHMGLFVIYIIMSFTDNGNKPELGSYKQSHENNMNIYKHRNQQQNSRNIQ